MVLCAGNRSGSISHHFTSFGIGAISWDPWAVCGYGEESGSSWIKHSKCANHCSSKEEIRSLIKHALWHRSNKFKSNSSSSSSSRCEHCCWGGSATWQIELHKTSSINTGVCAAWHLLMQRLVRWVVIKFLKGIFFPGHLWYQCTAVRATTCSFTGDSDSGVLKKAVLPIEHWIQLGLCCYFY